MSRTEVWKGGPRCRTQEKTRFISKHEQKARLSRIPKILTVKNKTKQDKTWLCNKTRLWELRGKTWPDKTWVNLTWIMESEVRILQWLRETWKLNTVGRWLVMVCSCEQKQVTWVKLNVTGEKIWQEINLEPENKKKQNKTQNVLWQ